MTARLAGDARTVEEGRVRITAPGLRARVEVHERRAARTRGEQLRQPPLDDLLARSGMVQDYLIELTEQEEEPTGRTTDRGEATRATMTVEVPAAPAGIGQALLLIGEDDVVSWHVPEDVQRGGGVPATRAEGHVRFVVPRTVAEQPAEEADGTHRGWFGSLGRKLLKVVAFRLAEAGIGMAADAAVGWWERRNRPHRLRPFVPGEHGRGDVGDLSPKQVRSIVGGGERALLFVHGTSSTTHAAFHALPDEFVRHLHEVYGGRVFAFDHPTISVTPEENVRWLAEHLADHVPPEVELDLDVVTHSRGGLVARVLAAHPEWGGLPARRVRIRHAVFGATPNAGTPLADPDHLRDYVDTWMNIAQFIPDNPVTGTLEVVMEVVKYLASGALGGLDGLQSMDPDAGFLSRLNGAGGRTATEYHALASDFEPPTGSGLGRFVRDRLTDHVFGGAGNDLVVPTVGVAGENGAAGFPVGDLVRFDAGDGVDHSGFWSRPRTVAALRGWLVG